MLRRACLNGAFWGRDVAVQLDGLGGRLWRRASEQRFAFRSPTLFLPELKALCGEPVSGQGARSDAAEQHQSIPDPRKGVNRFAKSSYRFQIGCGLLTAFRKIEASCAVS
jgi:hypothetical protein